MQRIYNILVSILGESKQGCYDTNVTQYQFNCPYCADEKGGVDNKYNLEISFSLGKFHCWSCGSAGPLSRLIKTRGGKSLSDEYFRIIKDIKENKYYDLSLFKDNGDMFEERYVRLPQTFSKINLSTCRDKWLLNYLNKRKITQDVIDFYNIGYTNNHEEEKGMKNRVIIPSYDINGDLNYWVGRDYMPERNDKESETYKTRIKYKNCNADKNDIVFKENIVQWDADIYLVEGIFDSLVYYNMIPLMGKMLTRKMALFEKLFEKANANIIICLDGDTYINETKRIYNLLNRGRLRGKIWYIDISKDSEYKDFAEIYEKKGKEGIVDMFKKKKQFSEVDLIY